MMVGRLDQGIHTICGVNVGQLVLHWAKQHTKLKINMLQVLSSGAGL